MGKRDLYGPMPPCFVEEISRGISFESIGLDNCPSFFVQEYLCDCTDPAFAWLSGQESNDVKSQKKCECLW